MKRFCMRRHACHGGVALVVAAAAVAVAFAAATAHAASNKPYSANVHQTLNTPNSFTLTLTNDPNASQSLGSANFTAPAGFVLGAVTAIGGTDASGFNVTTAGNIVQFRAKSSSQALAKAQTVSADVMVTGGIAGCQSATWLVEAKQSNDFSGTPGNNMTLNPASDLTPLGSFVFAPVESVTGPNDAPIHVPQILTVPPGSPTLISIKALDTCGNPDADYKGATLNKESGFGLANAIFSNPTWSTKDDGSRVGLGSVTPKDVEIGDQFTVNDPVTGISAKSVSTGGRSTFDVVETICTAGQTCVWTDKKNPIKATSTVPTDNADQALGLGYQPYSTTSVQCGAGSFTPVGDIVRIDPYNYDPASTLIIVITYDKSLVGSGPSSTLNVCKTTGNGEAGTWSVISACSNTPVAPCVDVRKVSGGNFQATLYLHPLDPGAGGLK